MIGSNLRRHSSGAPISASLVAIVGALGAGACSDSKPSSPVGDAAPSSSADADHDASTITDDASNATGDASHPTDDALADDASSDPNYDSRSDGGNGIPDVGVEVPPHDASIGECLAVRTWPGRIPHPPQYFRRTWDGSRRVVSEEFAETPVFTGRVDLAWRYGPSNELMAYAGFAKNPGDMYANFQHDYVYDLQGNERDFRLTYPPRPDVTVPSTASVHIGTEYRNEYDAQDRLTVSTQVGYGASSIPGSRSVFHEDAMGRCDRIETTRMGSQSVHVVELRSYDDKDRIARVETTSTEQNPFICPDTIRLTTYDQMGRIVAANTWCGRTTTGNVARSTTYVYGADGAVTVDSLDFTTDVPNDTIPDGDGGSRSAGHSIESRSAACAEIEIATKRMRDNRCWVR